MLEVDELCAAGVAPHEFADEDHGVWPHDRHASVGRAVRRFERCRVTTRCGRLHAGIEPTRGNSHKNSTNPEGPSIPRDIPLLAWFYPHASRKHYTWVHA